MPASLPRLLSTLLLLLGLLAAARAAADDTDLYLNPLVAAGDEPLVLFALDYRTNLGASACGGDECDTLIAAGYLPPTGPYTFFDVLRGALRRVLDPLDGVKIGFLMNHANSCTGHTTAGPGVSSCSNGGYALLGLRSMEAGSDDPETYQTTGEDPDKVALFDKLDAIPTPGGNFNHSFQGKELYFELFRYLTGQGVYNAHLGYQDFGDNNKNTSLEDDHPALSPDPSIVGPATSDDPQGVYLSPVTGSACSKIFVINFMFLVSNQEDDSDDAITASTADGGMGGINLSGSNNDFDTVIRYLKDADLANGTYGTVGDLDGKQNVLSYFLVDPTKINTTTNGYASAGGTGVALPLSDDPEELVATLNSIFKSILSVSAAFVAPSVPVNVYNRAQTVDEVFLALFEAEENGYPAWRGNLKKLKVGEDADGAKQLEDANGNQAIDIDGRIKRDAVTFWTSPSDLPAPDEDEIAGADGRAVARGAAGQKVPGFLAGSPGTSNADAGARRLFTEDPSDPGDGLMPLDAGAATAEALWAELTAHWDPPASDPDYDDATAAEREKALNILRYARGLADDGTTVREWLLGDPLHSRPRPINYGARGAYSDDNPDIRVLMGTNTGAMHMLRNTDSGGAQDGSETWAFFPRETLAVLDRLRSQSAGSPVHPAAVDGSPAVVTIDQNHDGNIRATDGDKAYAYFGLRRGGKAYYALDVSDPDNPVFLWKIEKGAPGSAFAELGQTWSPPQTGRVQVGADVIPVLVFGGGYDGDDGGDDLGDLGKDAKNRATRAGVTPSPGTDDDEGNALFIVNALDGTLVWKAVADSVSGYDSSDKAYGHPDLADSVPAEVAAVDTTGDGLLDRVYFADTGGVVWRVDLAGLKDHDANGSTPEIVVYDDPAVWTLSKLFTAGRHVPESPAITDDRRFFNRPDVVQSRDDLGPFDAVLIGTGDREDPLGTEVPNAFYLIKDRATPSGQPPVATLEAADLADLTSNCLQTASCGAPPDLTHGWRFDLVHNGEKNLAPALTAGGTVLFTTFAPTPVSNACGLSEGQGRLYAVSLQDATAVISFDTTNDGGSVTYERVDELGSGGIPVEIVPLGEGLVLVQGQEAGQNIMPVAGKTSFKTYWHELHE